MKCYPIKINTFLTHFAQKQKGFSGTIGNFIEQIQKAGGVGISMLPKPSALAIGTPKGSRTPDSSKIAKCDNINIFIIFI